MNIYLIFVLYNLQKLSSWIIYKVHVHVHILPNQDWLVPEFSTFLNEHYIVQKVNIGGTLCNFLYPLVIELRS
jgi:hypothetical protein